MDLEAYLFSLCEPVLNDSGYELVMIQVSGTGTRRKAVFFIDKQGGISVEDCAAASRRIDPLIEQSEVFRDSYVLEVSSPGLDRPLFMPKDYERFTGCKARILLRQPMGKRRRFTGILRGLENQTDVVIELDGGVQEKFPLESVQRANLVYEWK
jgi:ribosome maturation factor RimP